MKPVSRLLLLTMAAIPVFAGFAMPFIWPGMIGWSIACVLIVTGAALIWLAEHRSRSALDDDSPFNRVLKADGENLLGRDEH